MADPTDDERRIAREGVTFQRVAEADPLWHQVTIRLRLQTPLPISALTKSTGDAAARRFFMLCAANLHGAGLLTGAEAGRIKLAIENAFRSAS